MRKENFLAMVGFALTPVQQALVAKAAKQQEEIVKVMTILPGKYRYEQVKAAINASGTSPRGIYMAIAANERNPTLANFYEALHGPK